jgi:hypothetical protein
MAMPRKKPAPKAKAQTKTQKKREAKKATLPAVLRNILENPKAVVGRPTDYTPEACNQVIGIMETGLSLTAAAGIMGITRSTIHRWMKEHQEFSDSVELGKAKRVATLETGMLDSDNAAEINARRFALLNADPIEWRDKQIIETDVPADSPLRALAAQLQGTSIRPAPQLPAPTIVDHDANERPQPMTIRPQPQAAQPIASVTKPVTTPAVEPIAQPIVEIEPEDDDAPRIHTIRSQPDEDE